MLSQLSACSASIAKEASTFGPASWPLIYMMYGSWPSSAHPNTGHLLVANAAMASPSLGFSSRRFSPAATAAAAAVAASSRTAATASMTSSTGSISAVGAASADSAATTAPSQAPHAAPSTTTTQSDTPASLAPPLSFSNHVAVFEGQSTWQLLRAYGVLRACGFKPLVSNAESLLRTSRRILGDSATDALVKSSFFSHFCAGEVVSEVQRTVDRLRTVGVGAILDYAAEDDVGPTAANTGGGGGGNTGGGGGSGGGGKDGGSVPAGSQPGSSPPGSNGVTGGAEGVPGTKSSTEAASARSLGVVGRTYDYASEEQCDRHVHHFLDAIEMAARQPGRPAFAAIKMTALGNPMLLQRASTGISMLHGLFARFDEDGSGYVDRDEFLRQWRQLVGEGAGGAVTQELSRQAEDTFRWLDVQGTGKVDYVAWCGRLQLRHMPQLAARIAEGGSGQSAEVVAVCLDDQEVTLMEALLGRLQRLVNVALRLDVRLMIDAEHTYFQPAIDHVTSALMRQHNRDGVARVLNTYQAYLVDSRVRLLRDMERARREGWVLGAKLVRGAYLNLERRRAAQLGLPPPVWDSLAATHANYDACAADLLIGVADGRAEVLLGTHNQTSVELAVAHMAALGLPPAAPSDVPGVMLGQLLGMSDHLTLTLGKAGYRPYKYVPYGRVSQVMPYLLRRAAENQDIMQGSKQDLIMLRREIIRRARAAVGL